jgi:hypothetical protein
MVPEAVGESTYSTFRLGVEAEPKEPENENPEEE